MARPCVACNHPDKPAFNKALITTSESYKSLSDRFGLSETGLKNHYKQHVEPQYGPRPDPIRTKLTEAAVVQLKRVESASLRDQADMAIHQALEVQGAAAAFAKRLLEMVDDEGNPADPETILKSFKLWVDANGGGVLRALELKGRIDGDIVTGNQVNVQVNVALQARLRDVGTENGRWLAEDVPPVVRSALEEVGLVGGALERAAVAVCSRLVEARSTLAPRLARVLDTEAGT